jgi:hypothetical protein
MTEQTALALAIWTSDSQDEREIAWQAWNDLREEQGQSTWRTPLRCLSWQDSPLPLVRRIIPRALWARINRAIQRARKWLPVPISKSGYRRIGHALLCHRPWLDHLLGDSPAVCERRLRAANALTRLRQEIAAAILKKQDQGRPALEDEA